MSIFTDRTGGGIHKNVFSQQVKQSINGDEYYTPQNAVDMIVPYVLMGGGIRQYGVLLIRQIVSL